jgi:hypothetical protein
MSGPQPAPSADEEHGPGILGSLPRTRPSVRSPRRPEAAAEARPETGPQDEPEAASAAPTEASGRSREQELEDLAKAGLSLAGGAATLGLRVAGRAAAALRDAVERR